MTTNRSRQTVPTTRRLTSAVCVAVFCIATACTSTKSAPSEVPPWTIQPGVGVLVVTGAKPAEPITLNNDSGEKLLTVITDEFGQASFPFLPAEYTTVQAGPRTQIGQFKGGLVRAGNYTVSDDSADPPLKSDSFRISALDDIPDAKLYEQPLSGVELSVLGKVPDGTNLNDGFHYLTMRDGTKLSAMIRYPDKAIYGDGPWPTVIEYSGYGVANPEAEEPGARIARALGYATVSINLRGTGCSGGVFDVFNQAQQADGYDSIEIVARQPWVLHHKVGMIGLSYSGITQLYAAATNPPSLAAITPQSVIVDPWLQQWPGGIYNAGFTRRWLQERDRQAAPNGQDWAAKRVADGDETCAGYQRLRNMNVDFEAFGKSLEMRPTAADSRDLRQLTKQITAPTLLRGAFQDEQTGPQFASLIGKFEKAKAFKAAMWNGRHPDGYAPTNIIRLFEFLEFYVAKRIPKLNPALRAGLGPELARNFKLDDTTLEPDRFDSYGTDYDAALRAYEAEDPIRVTFESGAGGNEIGEPEGTFTRSYTAWPPADSKVSTWFLGDQSDLAPTAPAAGSVASFHFDPSSSTQSFTAKGSGGLLDRTWNFDWQRFSSDRSAVFDSQPLATNVVLAGPGEVELQVSVNGATDANLQVTLSELRPDGVEYYLQTGWLRIGHRVDGTSDSLDPPIAFTQDHYRAVASGEVVDAQISIPSIGAPIRAGSKLRLTVSSPGRDRAEWTFDNPSFASGSDDAVSYDIHLGSTTPSRLLLTTLNDAGTVPAGLAPCPALRGQACRTI